MASKNMLKYLYAKRSFDLMGGGTLLPGGRPQFSKWYTLPRNEWKTGKKR
jgi:hypothetical protein